MTGAPSTGETPSDHAARDGGEPAERRHLLVFSGASSWLYPLPVCGDVVIGRSEAADLRIDHGAVSRRHARLVVDGDVVSVFDLGSHNGTYVNHCRVTGRRELRPNDVITIHATTLVFHATTTASRAAKRARDEPMSRTLTVGTQRVIVADPSVAQLYALIERLAPVALPVLVTGETGSGKELVAAAIHALSPRAGKQLISLNCAALHEALVESELFGHERGAFSGAVAARAGLIEAASGSTLLLDEVGELAPAIQAKLLRVLESNRVTRLGDVRERDVDVRVVAATNRDLEADVATGRFRRDLFFRLSAATLHLPPLRERPRELPVLATAFLADACRHAGRAAMQISDDAMAMLLAHPWPGNVRELKNLMQYVAAALAADVLCADHLAERLGRLRADQTPTPIAPGAPGGAPPGAAPRFRPLADELRELEITRMREAIEATGGNQTRAAGLLGMPVRTFFEKAKQHGLTPRRKRFDD